MYRILPGGAPDLVVAQKQASSKSPAPAKPAAASSSAPTTPQVVVNVPDPSWVPVVVTATATLLGALAAQAIAHLFSRRRDRKKEFHDTVDLIARAAVELHYEIETFGSWLADASAKEWEGKVRDSEVWDELWEPYMSMYRARGRVVIAITSFHRRFSDRPDADRAFGEYRTAVMRMFAFDWDEATTSAQLARVREHLPLIRLAFRHAAEVAVTGSSGSVDQAAVPAGPPDGAAPAT